MTDKQLYRSKNEYLNQYYEEVSPRDFYRDVFPEGSFERTGHPEDAKGNGILTMIQGTNARNFIVFDDLDIIDEMLGKEFVVMSAVSYCGRNRTAKNARWLYGFTIDLDGVGIQNMRDVFYQMENDIIPTCTYCINSGHGLHLYYLLERPIALYSHIQDKLRDFKYDLISLVWNRYTSSYKERSEVQYQGIFQAFRMVGSQSKLGKNYPVKAFLTGNKVTIEYLNEFVSEDKELTDFSYQSELTLQDAKIMYPEWYEKRIVQGQERGRWHVKRDLYDWWLRKIKDDTAVTVGHRYSCLSVLATYGVKCDVPEDEVLSDAMKLLPFFDNMSDDAHNRFTKRDVLDAMKLYQESYVTFSRKEAERVSGIPIPPNKRNGRKQEVHLKRARAVQTVDYPNGEWRNKNGAPTKELIVKDWQLAHPDGKPKDCIEETGLSKNTVYKWWDTHKEDKTRRLMSYEERLLEVWKKGNKL